MVATRFSLLSLSFRLEYSHAGGKTAADHGHMCPLLAAKKNVLCWQLKKMFLLHIP